MYCQIFLVIPVIQYRVRTPPDSEQNWGIVYVNGSNVFIAITSSGICFNV